MIDIEKLKNRINKTIKIFYKNDLFLVKNKANERSMTHKLAEYIQKKFPEYNVDCEYNRMKKDENMNDSEYFSKKLGLSKKQIDSYDTDATTVYPDIIIHDRGNNKHNLLVIEVKKDSSSTQEAEDFDIKKIKAYIKDKKLGYDYGLFLKLFENHNETLKNLGWYTKNKE